PQERKVSTWVVSLADGRERPATEQERESFESLRRHGLGGKEAERGYTQNAVIPPVMRADGAAVWLSRAKYASTYLRVMTQPSPVRAAVACEAPECLGLIER